MEGYKVGGRLLCLDLLDFLLRLLMSYLYNLRNNEKERKKVTGLSN